MASPLACGAGPRAKRAARAATEPVGRLRRKVLEHDQLVVDADHVAAAAVAEHRVEASRRLPGGHGRRLLVQGRREREIGIGIKPLVGHGGDPWVAGGDAAGQRVQAGLETGGVDLVDHRFQAVEAAGYNLCRGS